MNIEALYRQDLAVLEQGSGDQHAIIHKLLPFVLVYAVRMQNRYSSTAHVMELVSVGNYVMVEKLEEAMREPNPHGFLLKWAKGEMIQYRRRYQNAITLPTTPGDRAYHLWNILDEFDTDEFDIEDVPSSTCKFDDTMLYEAWAALPTEKMRTLIARLFGLNGHAPETLESIAGGNSTTKVYGAAKTLKRYALAKMRAYLTEHYPQVIHTSGKAHNAYTSIYEAIAIPEKTTRKLDEAARRINERGEQLSMNKLRKESGVHTRYASAYLYRLRKDSTSSCS